MGVFSSYFFLVAAIVANNFASFSILSIDHGCGESDVARAIASRTS
jgi:hypothetical protein